MGSLLNSTFNLIDRNLAIPAILLRNDNLCFTIKFPIEADVAHPLDSLNSHHFPRKDDRSADRVLITQTEQGESPDKHQKHGSRKEGHRHGKDDPLPPAELLVGDGFFYLLVKEPHRSKPLRTGF